MTKKVNKNKFSFVALVFAFLVFAFNFMPLTNVVLSDSNDFEKTSSFANMSADSKTFTHIFESQLLYADGTYTLGSNGTTSSDNYYMYSVVSYTFIVTITENNGTNYLTLKLIDNNGTITPFNNVVIPDFEDYYSLRGSHQKKSVTGINYVKGIYHNNNLQPFISSSVTYTNGNRAYLDMYCGVVINEFDERTLVSQCDYFIVNYRQQEITGTANGLMSPGYMEIVIGRRVELEEYEGIGPGIYLALPVPVLQENGEIVIYQKVPDESDFSAGYNQGYSIGEQVGYNNGYNVGYQRGFESADTYPLFYNLFSAVVDAPINSLLSLVNVEILGINVQELFTALISIAFVICVIRLFTGG